MSEKKALKKYKITFHGDGPDVMIGHNGVLNVYKRNEECVIDENFLGVLKDAVIDTFVQDEDGKRRHIRIPTYQYSVEAL